MKKMLGLGLVGMLAMAAAATAEIETGVSVDMAAVSAYVWRGQVLNDEAVAQPGLTGTIGGFTVNAWSSLDLTDNQDSSGEFDEMDWTVSYSKTLGKFELGAGVVQYTFPNSTLATEAEDGTVAVEDYPGTVEVFASVGVDVPLAPSLAVYRDVDEIEGFYAVASVGHSFALLDKMSLDLKVSLGFGDADYNAGYFGLDDAALNDLVLSAALPIAVTDNLSLTPSIGYMMLPDSDLEDAAKATYGEKDSLYGGVALSLAF